MAHHGTGLFLHNHDNTASGKFGQNNGIHWMTELGYQGAAHMLSVWQTYGLRKSCKFNKNNEIINITLHSITLHYIT